MKRRWNTTGYYDGHQHGKNVMGIVKLVKTLFTMDSKSSLSIRKWEDSKAFK